MFLKGKYTKCNGHWRKLTLLACSLAAFALSSANVSAQQTVKRFILVNNVLMPFTTKIAPDASSLLIATVQNPYKAVISWSALINTTEYRIEQLNSVTNQWGLIYQGSDLSFIAQNLSVGLHAFRLRACGGDLCSDGGPRVRVNIVELFDTDLDGVLDYTDSCSVTPLGETVNSNGCSVSQLTDTDGDGIYDAYDACPGNTTGDDVNIVGCTLDQDSDGDGIIDRDDTYPFQHNTLCTD